MKTQCPHCSVFFDVDDDSKGHSATCTVCGKKFFVEMIKNPAEATSAPVLASAGSVFAEPKEAMILRMISIAIFVIGTLIPLIMVGSGKVAATLAMLAVFYIAALLFYAVSRVLYYLAEIAYNTRKK